MELDTRNISDKYKFDRLTKWTTELIKQDLQTTAFPYAVVMENFAGDFNIGTVVRNANAFNARCVYYLGNKHWDRRGAVGTHNYTDVKRIKTREELIKLKEEYTFVGVENSVGDAVPLDKFEWPDRTLLFIGEEGIGITPETLELCDRFVYIPQFGSVRSLNAGVASGIVMNDLVTKIGTKNVVSA